MNLNEHLKTGLTITEIENAAISRAEKWHVGGLTDWSPLEWAGAMAGEAGEACNAAKKLKRITDEIANINNNEDRPFALTDRVSVEEHLAKEVADTILYAVLVCARIGIPLEPVIIEVFNKKSEEYGFSERLGQ